MFAGLMTSLATVAAQSSPAATSSLGRLGRLLGSIVVAVSLVAGGVACSPNLGYERNSSQTVRALWYSGSGDKVSQGTAEVAISLGIRDYPSDFNLDLDTERAQGAGPAWTAATWSAASTSTLFSFNDPRKVSLSVSIDGAIDGPSAGGLMAATMLALNSGFEIKKDTTMTGTINPDGSIGMVAGIPAKLRAAHEAGMKRVLVPAGFKLSVDPATGKKVDTIEAGKKLGIEVLEVGSLYEALAYLTGKDDDFDTDPGPVQPISKTVLNTISKNTKALAVLNNRQLADAKKLGVGAKYLDDATSEDKQGQASDDSTNEVDEYAQQWHEYASLAGQISAKKTAILIKKEGAEKARDDLQDQVSALQNENASNQRSTGNLPADNIQQMLGIPDVLTWGTGPGTALGVYQDRLQDPDSFNAWLPMIAQGVGQARASIETGLSQSTAVLMASGSGSATQGDVSTVLNSYTDFLKQTGDANVNYYEQVVRELNSDDAKAQQRERNFSYAAADSLRTQLYDATQVTGGSLQDQRTRLSLAFSYYINSAALVVDREVLDVESMDPMDRNIKITNKAGFESAVVAAAYNNRALLARLREEKVDTSYAHWGVQWGEWRATREGKQFSDSERRAGLTDTWQASLQLLLLNSEPIEALKAGN